MQKCQLVIHSKPTPPDAVDLAPLVESGKALVKYWPDGKYDRGMIFNVAQRGEYSKYAAIADFIESCEGINKFRIHCRLIKPSLFEALAAEKYDWLLTKGELE